MTGDVTDRARAALDDLTRAIKAWRASFAGDHSYQFHVVECAETLTNRVPELLAEVERLRDELVEDTGVINALRRQRDTAEAEFERERARAREHLDARCRVEGRSEAWQMNADGWRQRATRAEAEVERLRGALESVVSHWKPQIHSPIHVEYRAAVVDHIDVIEAVLRGDQ